MDTDKEFYVILLPFCKGEYDYIMQKRALNLYEAQLLFLHSHWPGQHKLHFFKSLSAFSD